MSEKTIQRELQTLVLEGKVSKTGERRWTTYVLVEDVSDTESRVESISTNVDFTQMDAMTLVKSAFRTAAYYTTRGASAPELATFPVSVVMPNFFSELSDIYLNYPNLDAGDISKGCRNVLRAVIDFDGELETKYLLGDISDQTTTADIAEIASVSPFAKR